MAEVKRKRRKHSRKRKTQRKYQQERINGLKVGYSEKHKAFIVTHHSNPKEVLFESEWNKQEAINWALRHAWWSKLRIDKYKALVREFLLKPLGDRILDQKDGVVMDEVNQNTVRVFDNNELYFEMIKLGKDVMIKFHEKRIPTLFVEVERCSYFPFGRPTFMGKEVY